MFCDLFIVSLIILTINCDSEIFFFLENFSSGIELDAIFCFKLQRGVIMAFHPESTVSVHSVSFLRTKQGIFSAAASSCMPPLSEKMTLEFCMVERIDLYSKKNPIWHSLDPISVL